MECEFLLTQVTPGRISAPGVIILSGNPFEGRGLVNGHRAGAILVFLVRVFDRSTECGETVRLAGSKWRLGLRGWKVVMGNFGVDGGCHYGENDGL